MGSIVDIEPARLQLLLEAMNTAVVLLDGQLRLLYLNPAAEDLFDISRKQVCGQRWQEMVNADNRLVERMQQAQSSLHPYSEWELQMHTRGGHLVTVDCAVTPLEEQNLLLELKQLDNHLRIANEEQLIAQQRATQELLRGLAHEIKNPLGGLRGAAQLLEAELQQEQLKEYTQVITSEVDRLRNLVDRMLGPNSVPNKRPVNIHQLLEHVCNLVAVEIDGKVDIQRNYDPSIPELVADRDMLVQAILNLVGNAMQAEATSIVLHTRTERQFMIGHIRHRLAMRLDITDNGAGVSAEMKQKLFYPMVTGRAEGTGLGLSIAQSLVNAHGGIIEFTSKPGKTVFTILLPLETKHD
jgi:two-component system nitrogen regulation sensor histidine kinase GlnL